MVLCKRASEETGGKLAVSTLRADIGKWRSSATWGDRFAAALSRTNSAAGRSKDWYPSFYEALEEAGGRVALACEALSLDPGLVYALRDKRAKAYDREFDEEVRLREGTRFSKIRENVLEQAEQADIDGAKLGQKVLETAMPSLHAPRAHLEVSAKVEHKHTHYLPVEVVQASQARTRALLTGRQREALPSGEHEAIDVVPVLVDEKVGA